MRKKITQTKVFQLLLIWIVLVAIFSFWAKAIGETFFSVNIFMQILDLMIVTSFLAVGAGFLMVSGNLDLSASAIGAFGCVLFAVFISYKSMNFILAVILTLIVCICFGLANGLLVNTFKCPAFIATMAMSYVAKGCMQWVSVSPETGNPGTVYVHNDLARSIADGRLLGIPYAFFVALLVFIIYGIILSKTTLGMRMYLVGGNPTAAHLVGINPRKYIFCLFANSGFLAGIAGIIYMFRAGSGDLNALSLNQFTGLTAAILGGISFGGGNGNIAGVFVGLMILNTFSKGMIVVRANTYWTTVLTGVLLLVALIIDNIQTARARKRV